MATDVAPSTRTQPPRWWVWTAACGGAEFVGMAAAASAALIATRLVEEPDSLGTAAVVILFAVAGGAIEGLAVGALQFAVLRRWLPGLAARRWIGATVGVAVLGWLVGSTPPALLSWLGSTSDANTANGSDAAPPLLAVLAGGAVGGLIAGAVFGAAQAWALHGVVQRPRRWILANALGWCAALSVMMVGATLPTTAWSTASVLVDAVLTGIAAGLMIGAITGLFLPGLVDTWPRAGRRVNRVMLAVLRSPARRLTSRALIGLRYRGRRTGRDLVLVAQFAADDSGSVVIWPAHPERKAWWRNLEPSAPVELLLDGAVRPGTARLVGPDDPNRVAAVTAYTRRWPRITVPASAPLVVVALSDRPPSPAGPWSSATGP